MPLRKLEKSVVGGEVAPALNTRIVTTVWLSSAVEKPFGARLWLKLWSNYLLDNIAGSPAVFSMLSSCSLASF